MKIELITDKLLDHVFENLDQSKLDKWNLDFLSSTRKWWKQKRKLSDKQKMRLGELWEHQNGIKSK